VKQQEKGLGEAQKNGNDSEATEESEMRREENE
jgi:hypothetical protein